jgi:hypothetical protein
VAVDAGRVTDQDLAETPRLGDIRALGNGCRLRFGYRGCELGWLLIAICRYHEASEGAGRGEAAAGGGGG